MKKINKFILIALMSVIGIGTASGQCTASFTSTDNGLGDFSFVSTSTSPGANLYHHWEFGDGNYGSTQSPNHTYASPGTYSVCLTINDSIFGGTCTDSYCDSIIVTGTGVPCNLTAGISYVDNGLGNYTFTSTSTGNVANDIWSFGDGSSANGNSANHTFAANGTYVVSLLSSDSNAFFGCYDYATVTIVVTGIITPVPCQAGFVIYPDSLNGIIVVNSSTGTNLSYFWDFGDGNFSSLQFPSYTYTGNGPYNLCLTVTDSLNGGICTSTYCDSIGVNGLVMKGGPGFNINVIAPAAVGVEELKNVLSFEVFPNPVKNDVNIEFNLVKASNVEVFVTDLLGNNVALIVSKKMNAGNNKFNYNVSAISNGIYLLNIRTGNSLQVKKIVVNK